MRKEYYLVHVLKHQEKVHFAAHLHPLTVTNIKQSEMEKTDFRLFSFSLFLELLNLQRGTV